MSFWVLLHTLVWNGKAKSNSDLPFPFNIFGILVDNPATFQGRSGLAKEAEENPDFYQTSFDFDNQVDVGPSDVEKSYFPERYQPDRVQERLNQQSLGAVSPNGLYNFLVKPDNAAFNLILELSFVSVISLNPSH